MALVQRFRPDDVFLSTTPLYHAATGTRVCSMLADGQTHVVLRSFSPESFFAAVAEHRVTSLDPGSRATAPPPRSPGLCRGRPVQPSPHRLRRRPHWPGRSSNRAYERFGCGLYQGYGISECVTNLTGLLPEDHDLAMAGRPELLDSCGRVVPGVRIELHDDQRRPGRSRRGGARSG